MSSLALLLIWYLYKFEVLKNGMFFLPRRDHEITNKWRHRKQANRSFSKDVVPLRYVGFFFKKHSSGLLFDTWANLTF